MEKKTYTKRKVGKKSVKSHNVTIGTLQRGRVMKSPHLLKSSPTKDGFSKKRRLILAIVSSNTPSKTGIKKQEESKSKKPMKIILWSTHVLLTAFASKFLGS